MPAVIRRLRFHDGSIRLGPECFKWGDPYTRHLSFEVERVNVAVIGGLTWKPSDEEYGWVEAAMIQEGLRMAMRRYKRGRSYLVMMAMPHWPRCVAGCGTGSILPAAHIQPANEAKMAIDRSHLSKTHIPSPARAQKRDGSINMATVAKDAKKTFGLFESGKEVLLNLERVVLADGSVLDIFHHRKA